MAGAKKPSAFEERYASDPEFKRQVDDGRKRATTKRNHNALKEALDMVRGVPGAGKKRY